MKAEMFEKIVNARTDALVDEKINEFRKEVYQACRNLFGIEGNGGYYRNDAEWEDNFRAVIKILSSNSNKNGWPRELWENEMELVTKGLMKTFDEFTQARLAADKAEPPENKMEEEKKPEAADLEDDNPF